MRTPRKTAVDRRYSRFPLVGLLAAGCQLLNTFGATDGGSEDSTASSSGGAESGAATGLDASSSSPTTAGTSTGSVTVTSEAASAEITTGDGSTTTGESSTTAEPPACEVEAWSPKITSAPSLLAAAVIGPDGDFIVAGTACDAVPCESPEIYMRKIRADGTTAWKRGVTGNNSQALDAAVDADGDVYVAGYFQGTIWPWGKDRPGDETTGSATDADFLVMKVNGETGEPLWAETEKLDTVDTDLASAIAVGAGGDRVAITGICPGATKLLTAVYAADGTQLARNCHDSGSFARGFDVQALPDGKFVVVGKFSPSLTLGGITLDSAGETDGFVAVLDGDGAIDAGFTPVRIGGAGADHLETVHVLADGELVVGGYCGPDPDGPFAGCGDRTAFVARLDAAEAPLIFAEKDSIVLDVASVEEGIVVTGASDTELVLNTHVGVGFAALVDPAELQQPIRGWTMGAGETAIKSVGVDASGRMLWGGTIRGPNVWTAEQAPPLPVDLGPEAPGYHSFLLQECPPAAVSAGS
jgi:hypothetical protein